MRPLKDGDLYFFVDEAGDATFFSRKGKLIVGTQGCSARLMLGFIRLYDPGPMREEIMRFQSQVLSTPEFQHFPSLASTAIAFHAAKDAPPIRDLFFRLIQDFYFRAVFVVSRKDRRLFRKKFNCNTDLYYDSIISRLFQNSLHRYTRNHICIAHRGSRKRLEPLKAAIEAARDRYITNHALDRATEISVEIQNPKGEPCLSVIDYVAWAIQRAYTTGEMSYYRLVEDKVALIQEWRGPRKKLINYCNRRPFKVLDRPVVARLTERRAHDM